MAAITDYPGKGLKTVYKGEIVRMGKATWLGLAESPDAQMELWFQRGDAAAIRLIFADKLRTDAIDVISALQAHGLKVCLLSGDRPVVAARVATLLNINDVRAGLSPVDKVAAIEAMQAEGSKVLMVGDGLNDAAALTTALVSMSPSSGIDITQNAADLVYRGHDLSPALIAYDTARRTQALVKQNFIVSLTYNAIAIPAAILGFVTPLIAALAMSGSSLIVVLNALRLRSPNPS
jgi:P-type Cu2+ transporter